METIPVKMYKGGQIYISKTEIRKSPDFFPINSEITIDDREAYVYKSTDDRIFIRGLKGYLDMNQRFEIVKKSTYEYYIHVISRTQIQQQSKDNNDRFQSILEHTEEKTNVEYKAIEVDYSKKKKESVEEKAVRIFEQYLNENSDRFAAIVKGGKVISDIRKCRNGYNSVFADYVVYDKIRKENVYFEIKGTSKTDQYWGGVTFKELISALSNRNNYYFAIICTDNRRKDHFIHSKKNSDPYSVFMDLEEFIKYSTRASLGIQFVIKYPNGENGELQMSKNGNNAYKINDIESILDNEFIQELISGK